MCTNENYSKFDLGHNKICIFQPFSAFGFYTFHVAVVSGRAVGASRSPLSPSASVSYISRLRRRRLRAGAASRFSLLNIRSLGHLGRLLICLLVRSASAPKCRCNYNKLFIRRNAKISIEFNAFDRMSGRVRGAARPARAQPKCIGK